MRILYLIEELNGGGKERRMVNLLSGLSSKKDIELHLILSKSGLDYQEVEGLDVHIHKLKNPGLLSLFFQYQRLIRKINPDIIHTWSVKTSFYVALLKPLFGYKFVCGFIGDTFQPQKHIQFICINLLFKMANAIVSNSKQGLISYSVPLKKGRVVYNGIKKNNSKTHKEGDILESLGILTSINIVMVGNVTWYKNYDLFIEVANDIVNKRSDVGFVAIGKIWPQYEELVFPYIDSKNDRIKFLGFVNNPEKIVEACDIGLLCSDREGISNSIMEYMRAGLPVITTDVNGASKELIKDGKTGIICSNENLRDNILMLINNQTLRKNLGGNGLDLLYKKFSIEIMINEYLDLYNEFFSTKNYK